jgi:hypothetical protein
MGRFFKPAGPDWESRPCRLDRGWDEAGDAWPGLSRRSPGLAWWLAWFASGFEDSAPATCWKIRSRPRDRHNLVARLVCRGFEDSAPAICWKIRPRSHDRMYPRPHICFVLEGT